MVKCLKNRDIDRKKWDSCIEGAVFETLYPYSWYLDLVNPGWDALVKGDYEMIMPLTQTRKYGFNLLLQPILAQQLGLFAPEPPTGRDIREFVSEISNRYRYVNICLNKENNNLPTDLESRARRNYELLPSKARSQYNSNTKRNIQKGQSHSFEFRKISIKEYLDLKFSPGEEVAVGREYMEQLFRGIEGRDRAEAFGVFIDDQLQAAAVLGYANTRVIYMNGCSSPGGKDTRAMFILMDQLIEHSEGKARVFDLEGSDLAGVARFFEGFGGKETIYHRIISKKFPFTLMRG